MRSSPSFPLWNYEIGGARLRFGHDWWFHHEQFATVGLSQTRTETATGIRYRALLAVSYRAGLRITETTEMRPRDLVLPQGMIRMLFANGGKVRTMGIDGVAAGITREWLTSREQREVSEASDLNVRSPLF